MNICTACGGELPVAARFCPGCGYAVMPAVAPPAALSPPPPPLPLSLAPPPSRPGVPSTAIAGFILSLLGLVTAGATCVVGLPLSWAGYRQAMREGVPSGLAVAGIVVNIIGLIVLLALIALVLLGIFLYPDIAPNQYTY